MKSNHNKVSKSSLENHFEKEISRLVKNGKNKEAKDLKECSSEMMEMIGGFSLMMVAELDHIMNVCYQKSYGIECIDTKTKRRGERYVVDVDEISKCIVKINRRRKKYFGGYKENSIVEEVPGFFERKAYAEWRKAYAEWRNVVAKR